MTSKRQKIILNFILALLVALSIANALTYFEANRNFKLMKKELNKSQFNHKEKYEVKRLKKISPFSTTESYISESIFLYLKSDGKDKVLLKKAMEQVKLAQKLEPYNYVASSVKSLITEALIPEKVDYAIYQTLKISRYEVFTQRLIIPQALRACAKLSLKTKELLYSSIQNAINQEITKNIVNKNLKKYECEFNQKFKRLQN